MPPKYPSPQFPPPPEASADNLVANADVPPAWKNSFKSIPLLGTYMNIGLQAQDYYTALEDCADFMVADLEKGLQSEWIGKRVSVKEKAKAG